MRGQAHVVFSNVVDSNLAMKSLQGDNFFGKNLVIQRAKTQSHIIERLES
ncbi:hypothetical protein PACTADRAFT_52869 [Pachysolen tannophilus NRRL Y-2460]|uniref:RRM domain-containing protein n=1 Tax=Pachysolen tannophilus NRRL Y-2460 TaxID=669874 RepID=A0A1E4U1E3_PACTA|nr:hypothetical protein PACTADRAFT_52869 [Pachysolen tannophilus NRRL Y-2460]